MYSNFVLLFLVNSTHEVLLLRRINTPFCDGCYALPGGKIEPGETAREALVREAKDLIGVDLAVNNIHCIHVMHRKCNEPEFFACVFTTSNYPTEPFNNNTILHDTIGWYSVAELPQPMVPAHAHAIKMIQEQQLYSEHGWELYG